MSTLTRSVLSGLIFATLAVGVCIVWGGTDAPPAPLQAEERTQDASRGTAEDPDARRTHELRRLRDPSTGQIPKNARKKDLAFAERLPERLQKAGTNSWQPRGPRNVGGRSRALAVDVSDGSGETLLAGGVSGGMWRTTDGGANWTRTFDPSQRPSVSALAQDPRAARQDVWFVGTGERISNSAGGGGAPYRGNGIYKSTDGGQSWTLLPSTSSNEDEFDSLFDYTYAVEVDSSAPKDGSEGTDSEVYAATYGGIQRSTDGGSTWATVLDGLAGAQTSTTDVAVTSSGVVYATMSSDGDTRGLYRSTDGTSWTEITPSGWPSGQNTYFRTIVSIYPSDESEVWFLSHAPGYGPVGADGQGDPIGHILWRYDADASSGNRWTNFSDYLPTRGDNRDTVDDGKVTGDFNSQGGYDLIVEVHPDSGNLVYVGGRNLWRIDVSADPSDANTWIGGYTSTNSSFAFYNPPGSDPHHPDQHALAFEPGNGDVMYVGSDGGIHRTDDNRAGTIGSAGDGSVAWTDLNNGYFTTQFYAVCQFQNPDGLTERTRLAGGMQDNGTWTTASDNVADPWQELLSGDGGYCALTNNATDSGTSRYVSVQNGRVFRRVYDENGTLQTFAEVTPPSVSGQLFINPFALDPSAADVMYYPAADSLWRNNDIENNPSSGWTNMTGAAVPSDHVITALGASANNSANVLYYGTAYAGSQNPGDRGKVFRLDTAATTSAGTQPAEVTDTQNFPQGGYVTSIAVDPTDSDNVLVAFSNYNVTSLFYSTDGGSNWSTVEGNLGTDDGFSPSVRSAAILPQPGLDPPQTTYFIGTSIGVYSTTTLDGANTNWIQEGGTEIGDVVVDQVQARAEDGRVIAGTHANGTYSISKPIPVELTGFDATVDGRSVHLTWTTASETDNSGFEVQHRYRGAPFETLDFVPGQGTTAGPQTYEHTVTDELAPGPHTFRLKQLDTDGTAQYSEPQQVTLSPEDPYALTKAAPNPFRERTTMRLTVRESQSVTAVVYNTLGQRVRTLLDEEVPPDRPIDLRLNGRRFASGIYVVQVAGETFEATRKVTVVK